jgi:hypothetical protein
VLAHGDDRNVWHNAWTAQNGCSGWADDLATGTFIW